MKVQFKVDIERSNTVYLITYYSGKRFVFYTEEKDVNPKEWDEKKQRFRKSYLGSTEANRYLDVLEEKVKKSYREFTTQGVVPTSEQLRRSLGEQTTSTDFFTVWADYQKDYYSRGNKQSNSRQFKRMTNHFVAFEKYQRSKLEINGFTEKVYERWMKYNLDKAPNTIGRMNGYLITFFNWCKAKGYKLSEHQAKIKKIVIPSEKIFLTFDELAKLEAIELTGKLDRVRDSFLFSCYTGLRYSDLYRLGPEMIIESNGMKVISIIPQKTNRTLKRLEVPLLPSALRLVQKYSGISVKSLPVISNQNMNDYLKELGKLAAIDQMTEKITFKNLQPVSAMVPKYELITTHVARHTFATLSLQKGISIEIVSALLGHSDLKTTQIYAKIADNWKNSIFVEKWKNED